MKRAATFKLTRNIQVTPSMNRQWFTFVTVRAGGRVTGTLTGPGTRTRITVSQSRRHRDGSRINVMV
jgi:hypothetical protein